MSERSYNLTLGRLRRLLLFVVVLALLALATPTPQSVAFGLIFVALGEAVRFWSAGHLLKTQELVTSGPYRFSRNPLYLGRLLIFSGLCLMVRLPYAGSWVAIAIGWGVFFFYYLRRKERVEPARLRELHGEAYDRYFRAVPALFPTLRPYRDGGGRWSTARMLRNREHWMVIGLATITLLLLWRATAAPGTPILPWLPD